MCILISGWLDGNNNLHLHTKTAHLFNHAQQNKEGVILLAKFNVMTTEDQKRGIMSRSDSSSKDNFFILNEEKERYYNQVQEEGYSMEVKLI